MIQTLLSVVGGFVLLIGILIVAGIWLKSQFEAKLSPIIKQLEDRTGIDIPDFGKMATTVGVAEPSNDRLDALKDAEALLKHFEDNKNTAGQAAMQGVVQALFTKPQ
jgi:hypothetical protein